MVKELFYEYSGKKQFLKVEKKKILEFSCSCENFKKDKKCSHYKIIKIWIEFGKEK